MKGLPHVPFDVFHGRAIVTLKDCLAKNDLHKLNHSIEKNVSRCSFTVLALE